MSEFHIVAMLIHWVLISS